MNPAPVFQAFGPSHFVVIALTIILSLGLAFFARRFRSENLDRAIRCGLALVLIINYLSFAIYLWRAGQFQLEHSLPFHLCDWTMIAIIVALFNGGRPRWLEVTYFWGIGGSLQAIITPNLQAAFPDPRFLSFFLEHGGIVIGIVYLMITRRFRPTLGSVWRTLLWSEFYLVVAFSVDLLTGENYGFLLHKPQAASLLSVLSDWRPLYLLQMNLLAWIFFALLYAPFALVDLCRKSAGRAASSSHA